MHSKSLQALGFGNVRATSRAEKCWLDWPKKVGTQSANKGGVNEVRPIRFVLHDMGYFLSDLKGNEVSTVT
jgi:hypothetical protein